MQSKTIPPTVLITGAGGFIGSHLSEHYLEKGYRVIGIDNFCTGFRQNKSYLESRYKDRLYFYELDITDNIDTIEAKLSVDELKNVEYVFHFASPASPPHYQRLGLETLWTNSIGLKNCLIFADKLNARVIFASTSEVYGDPAISPQSESYWGNVNSFGERSCYDEAKRFGESLIFTHNKRFGTNHGLVRIFNTYGPRMNPSDGRVIINFIIQALKREAITIYGDGTQTRSFCYISDLIDGITKYAKSNICTPLNLGNDREFSMLELANIVAKVTSTNPPRTFKELPADDPKQRRPNLDLAKELLGYDPQVSLEEGISKMAKWVEIISD